MATCLVTSCEQSRGVEKMVSQPVYLSDVSGTVSFLRFTQLQKYDKTNYVFLFYRDVNSN